MLFFFFESQLYLDHDEKYLFKYIENFTSKDWNFSDKFSDIFHISAQNIDCGSNEYPQSMLFRNNNNV